jgi:hypothetical protein
VSAKRGDRIAPPPVPDEWDVIFGTNDAGKCWDELCAQAANNTRLAWQLMRTGPVPAAMTSRHHRLKGSYATGTYRGKPLPQWQIEVTSGGRIWYLAYTAQRRVIIMHASPRHPKPTE